MHVEFRGELRGRGHKFRTRSDNQQTSIDTVRSRLDDIVARQLVADVPCCVLLSGGLDSSVITTLAAAQLGEHGERVRSFAVDFAGQTETFTPEDMRATPTRPRWPLRSADPTCMLQSQNASRRPCETAASGRLAP
jgi:hypothetical protein